MPVVHFTGATLWLPDASEVLWPGFNDRIKYQPGLTKAFLEKDVLPKFVVDAINEVDGSELTTEEVIIHVHQGHPWSFNASDWVIDVFPGAEVLNPSRVPDAEGESVEQRRRIAISNSIGFEVDKWLCKPHANQSKRPSYEIDVKPLTGSGMAYDRNGEGVATW